MSHIFISYSRKDKAYVSSLIQALESRSFPVWLDDRIDYGTTWPRIIREQLEACQVFLVVMSPRSEDSLWVQNELTLAQKLNKPVFPLLLEGDHWFQILTTHSVDVTGGKLPPARFFDNLRPYFLAPTPTTESLSIQDVATDSSPLDSAPLSTTRPRFAGSIFLSAAASNPVGSAPPTTTPLPQPSQDDDLSSEKGVDYRKLRDFLKSGQWKEADQETDRRMLEAVGHRESYWIRKEELLNFPCSDLCTIDAMWVKYSNGKWGFSIQKHIYVECGATLDGKYPGDQVWENFCRRLGWKEKNGHVRYSDLKFDLNMSPYGQLPTLWGSVGGISGLSLVSAMGSAGVSALAWRLISCNK